MTTHHRVLGTHAALPATPAMLVVIHQTGPDHAAEQALLAFANGADGVFLINHFHHANTLLDSIRSVREVCDGWVGVNPLGMQAQKAAEFVVHTAGRAGRIDGLWCDDAGIDERRGPQDQPYAAGVAQQLEGWPGLYFGGVSFKGQRPVLRWADAARAAAPWMDVVCTSGPRTGFPAPLAKLQAIAEGAGPAPVAVASGVNEGNVDAQLAHVSAVLVASSISLNDTDLDDRAVRRLAEIVRATPGRTASAAA